MLLIKAPSIDPGIIGIARQRTFFQSISFFREKLPTAVRFCKKTAIRFVPLAIFSGNPNIIKTEREIIVPPPAKVLINPTTMPEITKIIQCKKDNMVSNQAGSYTSSFGY